MGTLNHWLSHWLYKYIYMNTYTNRPIPDIYISRYTILLTVQLVWKVHTAVKTVSNNKRIQMAHLQNQSTPQSRQPATTDKSSCVSCTKVSATSTGLHPPRACPRYCSRGGRADECSRRSAWPRKSGWAPSVSPKKGAFRVRGMPGGGSQHERGRKTNGMKSDCSHSKR